MPAAIRPFRFIETGVAGTEAIISRTGYTGEEGLEIYLDPSCSEAAWEALMAAGAGHGIKAVGLGARDTLRLEMGYPLFGYEISGTVGPIEAGLKRFVALGKDSFIGSEALRAQSLSEPEKVLVGIELEGPGVPRTGYELFSDASDSVGAVGRVTSGTFSPVLKRGIAMAYVRAGFKEPGTRLEVRIRSRVVPCFVVSTPFYRRKKG